MQRLEGATFFTDAEKRAQAGFRDAATGGPGGKAARPKRGRCGRDGLEKEMKRLMRKQRHGIAFILLNQWDPIGIRDEPDAQDEYDDYVDAIENLMVDGASAAEIVRLLTRIEQDKMGLTPDHGRAAAVAGALAALRD